MTPALARLKQAARTAVEMCGGVDGAAATTGRGRSTCGRWMNRNDDDLPTLDSALALDGVAVARGDVPPIATAFARELGLVLLDPPEGAATRGDLMAHAAAIATASGRLHAEFCLASIDGIDRAERAALRELIAAAQMELSAMDAALSKGDE